MNLGRAVETGILKKSTETIPIPTLELPLWLFSAVDGGITADRNIERMFNSNSSFPLGVLERKVLMSLETIGRWARPLPRVPRYQSAESANFSILSCWNNETFQVLSLLQFSQYNVQTVPS